MVVEQVPYKGLSGSDFIKPPRPKEQAIVLIFGLPGHGKTTLGLDGAPGPVSFFDIDKRGRHAARKATRKGKVIHYLAINIPRKIVRLNDQALKAMAERELNRVRKNLEIAVREAEKGNVRTIVFDTVTEFGGLVNMSITGRVDKKKDDFGKSTHLVKAIAKELIEMVREDSPANMILLARAKEIWVGRDATGKYRHEGLDTFEYECDWAAHIRLARDRKTKLHRTQGHELEVTKAGIALKQLGAVYTEEEWGEEGPFVYGCVKNYPGTKAEDWK